MTDYFDNWFFTTNATGNVCPGFGSFKCLPPHACARDPNTGKRYCCDSGVDAVCWTTTSKCATDGSTIDCGSGTTAWCCLDKTEVCTGAKGQINICWSSTRDTLRNISTDALSSAHSSLLSAQPSASSLVFTPVSLIALTAPPASTTTSATTTATTTSGTQTTPAPAGDATGTPGGVNASPSETATPGPSSGSSSLTGGAIAGIAVGAAAGIAILALAAFFFWRHTRRKAADSSSPLPPQTAQTVPPNGGVGFHPQQQAPELQGSPPPPSEYYYSEAYAKHDNHYPNGGGGPLPGYGHVPPSEMEQALPPQELAGSHPGWTAHELPTSNGRSEPTWSAGGSPPSSQQGVGQAWVSPETPRVRR